MCKITCDIDDDKYAKKSTYDVDEDKHAKSAGEETSDAKISRKCTAEPLSKYPAKLGFQVPWHFLIYACFVLVSGFTGFTLIIANAWSEDGYQVDTSCKFVMVQLEILGLVMVREKIKSRNSVSGISGMTFVMQAAVYFSRVVWCATTWQVFNAALGLCPFLLVLDILKSIFVTRHDTYDAELDVLKAWYIIPVCCATAILMRPTLFDNGEMYNLLMSSMMYVDALTLMPQVVMMAKSEGKVQAPIANFVAATAIARCGDVFHTLFIVVIASDVSNWTCFRLWMTGDLDDFASHLVFSWVTCVLVHIVQLILVVDFLYYFYKARAWESKVTEEITLFTLDNV